MAALKITPGLISKLATSLSSTWFRCANPSATSQLLFTRGYGSDAVVGAWMIEGKDSAQKMGKILGASQDVVKRNTYNDYVVIVNKHRTGFNVLQGPIIQYNIPAKGNYTRPMPMYGTRMMCLPKFLDNGISERCFVYHPETGEKIVVVFDKRVENGKMKERVHSLQGEIFLDFRKL